MNIDTGRVGDPIKLRKHGHYRGLLARRWTACWLGIFLGLLLVPPVGGTEEPLVLPVWPGPVPGDFGEIGPERVRAPSEAPTKDAKWITNVTKPTLTVFRPDQDRNTGAAVIICPGGGYWNLAWDLEGEEVAAWLNTLGVTGIVLKYRVPRRPGQPELLPAPGPLLDAQRAVSLVRNRAPDWGIDPNRIGIAGFSAGGHLAVATATHFDQRAYEPIDVIDKISCRPNFAIGVYSGYFIEQRPAGTEVNKSTLAPYMRIPKTTPPIFLAHASDDPVSGVENSLVMHLALKEKDVPTELHVYARGGHGFGVRKNSLPCSTWTDRCAAWLQDMGMLSSNTKASLVVKRDIPYADPADPRQKVDIYAPEGAKDLPVVFWIHGGGWQVGDRSEIQLKPQAFVDQGFVFVSTGYRLLPDVGMITIFRDIAKSFRWVHDHIAEHGGDPKRVLVMGHSAGAQLAALICTDDRYLKAEGLSLSSIKGCVPVDGDTYDLPAIIVTAETRSRVHGMPMPKFGHRVKFGNDPALHVDYSAVTHVTKDKGIPPFLILHVAGHPDTSAQARRLESVLENAGIPTRRLAARETDHSKLNENLGLPDDPPTKALFDFVDEVLKE